MRRVSLAFVATATVLIAMATVVSSWPAGTRAALAGDAEPAFYVSLGDSLSVGYQPGRGETHKGYVDDLWRRVRERVPSLQRRAFGCVGETTESLLTGDGSQCDYAEGSQLDAAVAFLESHGGQVSFITIDVGSNDLVDACFDFDTAQLDRSCVEALMPDLDDRLVQIVGALRTAAGPEVPILGMTYYNPFLGLWGHVPRGRALARIAQRGWAVFDAGLVEAYENADAVVADVATTFRVEDFDHTALVHGERVPVNVALACRWTWFCSDRAFGDPHANATGYRKIARTFDRELRPLLG